ncbi:FAD-binding domain-containing protein [Pelagicoccus sp. SDUM812002]|uniref:FAD-binding domain-containing protein n=1 Tax=Pelagicoccus sp. SDUM812002 TaxID=3041266 RepID=UPI00280DCDB2|nr:FAD-binding domain-containing protein [Pelagicoccus sp. SDUM812002]MDQ8188399.1 FAD-binding domain-containing protein [Pelagicoccus sp. SDUM812002]
MPLTSNSEANDLPPTAVPTFPPTRHDALAQLDSFVSLAGDDYRSKRNYDFGPAKQRHVSQLSPYLRNGLISEAEVVSAVLRTHTYKDAEKFLQEVFWRVYWKGYLENRSYIWKDYREDLASLKIDAENDTPFHKAVSATTGIECLDTWSRELVETGYLHNHARMWFASIWVFTLRLPWQLGADFFLRHLLDGDPASNTLSWRWVAGLHTKGKTYLARPSNIARYTADRFETVSGLATQASPIDDSHPHHPAKYNEIPPPPSQLSQTEGLLVLDEDLRKHTPSLDSTSPVLGLYPERLYKDEDFSPKVARFRQACLRDTLDPLQSEHGCPIEHTTNPNADRIHEWATRHNLTTLYLANPQIGPWGDLWGTISPQLEERGIALSYFRPWWENELFAKATSGFFKFKKDIDQVADRMRTDDNSRDDGSS